MRIFGRQISFIGKIYRATFYKPLFGGKIKPAGRNRDILKDNCFNRHTSTACVFAAGVLMICLFTGVAFAQNQPDRSEFRIVHFPANRSVGQLSVQDASRVRRITHWFHWGDPTEWEYLGQAQGDVHVPAGKRLRLVLNKTAWKNWSWLSKLRPDDIYELIIPAMSTDTVKPSDRCMPYIARLTGLRSLNIEQTDVTDKGLRYIKNLKQLHLLDIQSDNSFSDTALRSLQRELPNLFILRINGGMLSKVGGRCN